MTKQTTTFLYSTDYVLFNEKSNDAHRDSKGKIVVYGDINEAIADCYGNEVVISCVDLPKALKEEIQNQILMN